MSNQRDKFFDPATLGPERANWLRLGTLILLRWMAIIGQIVALVVASLHYDLQLPLGPCSFAVGLAVIANLISIFLFPQIKRLTETAAMLTLLFDLGQLCFLLYLTGGLTNPFALLVLAPVTVSASVLALRSTLILGAAAAGFVTFIGLINLPLRGGYSATYSKFQVGGYS